MTTPSDPEQDRPAEGVNLGKSDPSAEAPFDPYRFGRPDHPIPAEYAPPGYTGPTIPAPGQGPSPYQAPNPWAQPPGGQPGNPFSNPPGTPYTPGQQQQQPYQYPPPPPSAFGPGIPPPPPYHGYVQPRAGNGKAVTALVLGILSIVCCWLSFFDAVFVISGLVFALIALNEAKRGGPGRGMAVAALVCTVVGAIAATVLTVVFVHAINQCGGFDNTDGSDFRTCVQDHL